MVETAVFMRTLERLQAELRQEQALRGQADMALAAMQAQAASSSGLAGHFPAAQAAAGEGQQQHPTNGGTWVPGRPSHAQNHDSERRLQQGAAGGTWEAGQPYSHAQAGKSGDEAGDGAAGGSEDGSDATAAMTAATLAAHSHAGHLTAPADVQAPSVAATLGSISPGR